MIKKARKWALGGLAGLGLGQTAIACAFHGYIPDPTLVDLLLATEHVVVARVDPSDPSRYAPIEALLGPQTQTIPIAVDPTTRARLDGQVANTVLLARDGAYGPWVELAVLDAGFRTVVDHVMARQTSWVLGRDPDRLTLFASYVNDPNPDMRSLALQELDRAPYAALQALRLPEIQNLSTDLVNGDADLRPIRILLAGLSKDQNYSEFLSQELDAAIQSEKPYLGAYATALIELEGKSAARDIIDRVQTQDDLSVGARIKLLEALALQHKNAPAPTRRVISHGLTTMLQSSPELRDTILGQFGFAGRWGATQSATGAGQATSLGNTSETDR